LLGRAIGEFSGAPGDLRLDDWDDALTALFALSASRPRPLIIERRRVLSLGEVKWGRTMSMRDLSRLERARDLLAQNGFDTAIARLACYSGSGFDDHLREAAASRADVLLVDPDRLYA
jgi:hypothetical protein